MKKINAVVIQARMGSSRLPGKVLKPIHNKSSLVILIERLLRGLDKSTKIIVATSDLYPDNKIVEIVESYDIDVIRGSENDVQSRYIDAIKEHNIDLVCRITSDCPMVDPFHINEMMSFLEKNISKYDYVSNTLELSYPDGFDIEIFKSSLLRNNLYNHISLDKEHVTYSIRKSDKVKKKNFYSNKDYSKVRLTLDTKQDLEVLIKLIEFLNFDIHASFNKIIETYIKNQDSFKINNNILRNSGMKQDKSSKIWERAKEIIPGGNSLLSKRPTMFLQENWPSYFEEAHDITVKDVNGRYFKDFSIFGIGTNILGYANKKIDEAVIKAVQKGTMCSLNPYEEVNLAERLIDINPWAEMVRFAKTGGEANAIAIRIARVASGKNKVAICGYHGWHDWYLSTNLGSKNGLNDLLLPGLSPAGIPKELEGTTRPFIYNDKKSFLEAIDDKDVGVVKMEVLRNNEPEEGFLEFIRDKCDEKGIVLIFDECTSGFRETFGGVYSKYNVIPDMIMYGKAMGNGYPITAVVGKKEVMIESQKTFISSTFWTDRIGFVAGLKTLEEMERVKSWQIATNNGNLFRKNLRKTGLIHGLDITFSGMKALTVINFGLGNEQICKTFFTQEMLKKGYLASNLFYSSILHVEDEIKGFCSAAGEVFAVMKDVNSLESLLENGLCDNSFKRLN